MKVNLGSMALRNSSLGSSGQSEALARQPESQTIKTVGEQLTQSIFTRPRPMLLDAAEWPDLQELLNVLEKYRGKLASLAGDHDADYALVLAADGSAAIDDRGYIFLGAGFLRANKARMEVLVGAIAHEIGHQPKRMRALQVQQDLSREQLNALLLMEEIRADTFAGRGLGELDMSCEPLIAYLRSANAPPHPAYLPIENRAQVIRDGWASGHTRASSREKLFPDFHRHTSMRNHLGEF